MFGQAGFSLRVRATAIGVALIALSVLGVTMLTAGAGAGVGADLAVEKTDSPDPVDTGELLAYTITVENLDVATTAENVSVEDKLPAKLDFVSATPSQGTCDRSGRTVSCDLTDILASDTATIEIVTRPKKDGTVSNTATVTSDNDPIGANNSDTETTKIDKGPSCGGKAATIVGTDGNDLITGTEQRDVIAALGGDDEVNSLGGKDAICGKSGNDKLKGKGDDDLVKGGGGRDKARGGGGNDELRGGAKRDRLRGGAGNDLLAGGGGNDSCRGGSGSDVLQSC